MGTISGCEGLQVVEQAHDGHFVIEAHDSFDLPELDCHTCQPNVPVYFRFENGRSKDVSGELTTEYDRAIRAMRRLIRPRHKQALLAARTPREIVLLPGLKTGSEAEENHKPFDEMASRVHEFVIRIAFYYVISGRPQQAWQTLDEMWPQWDRQRLKNAIVQRVAQSRSDGILKNDSR